MALKYLGIALVTTFFADVCCGVVVKDQSLILNITKSQDSKEGNATIAWATDNQTHQSNSSLGKENATLFTDPVKNFGDGLNHTEKAQPNEVVKHVEKPAIVATTKNKIFHQKKNGHGKAVSHQKKGQKKIRSRTEKHTVHNNYQEETIDSVPADEKPLARSDANEKLHHDFNADYRNFDPSQFDSTEDTSHLADGGEQPYVMQSQKLQTHQEQKQTGGPTSQAPTTFQDKSSQAVQTPVAPVLAPVQYLLPSPQQYTTQALPATTQKYVATQAQNRPVTTTTSATTTTTSATTTLPTFGMETQVTQTPQQPVLLPFSSTTPIIIQTTNGNCPEEIEALGCFGNQDSSSTPFPLAIVEQSGQQSIEDLMCTCANEAQRRGWYTIALSQGVCYSGDNESAYDMKGESDQCVNDSGDQCTDADTYCQGNIDSISVYTIITNDHPAVEKE